MTKKIISEDMALSVGAKALHEGRAFMYESGKKYRESFIDPNTGYFCEKYLETRKCPVCDSDSKIKIFERGGGKYVKCTNCTMVYLNPSFSDEELENYYRGYATTQSDVVKNESDFYRRIYTKGLESIEKNVQIGKILDIGCSSGFFLDIAKERGWDTYGIELNEKEIKEAIKKGHKVENCILEKASFNIHFDAIVLWDVIEHIRDGGKLLKEIGNHLSNNGVLFMQTPNSESLAAKIMHEKCNMFDGLEHVNVYNPKTLELLGSKSGFKICNLETVISEIPIIENYLSYEDPYLGEAQHNGKIAGIIDEILLHKNLLGYKTQSVMKKI